MKLKEMQEFKCKSLTEWRKPKAKFETCLLRRALVGAHLESDDALALLGDIITTDVRYVTHRTERHTLL